MLSAAPPINERAVCGRAAEFALQDAFILSPFAGSSERVTAAWKELLMQFEIPDGAHVQIVIGKTPPLALADQTGVAMRQATAVRSMIRGAVVAALLCGAFVAGKQFGAVRTVAPAAAAAQAAPNDHPADGSVPPEFAQQLRQPPVVVPPPAHPPSGKSPFGLDR